MLQVPPSVLTIAWPQLMAFRSLPKPLSGKRLICMSEPRGSLKSCAASMWAPATFYKSLIFCKRVMHLEAQPSKANPSQLEASCMEESWASILILQIFLFRCKSCAALSGSSLVVTRLPPLRFLIKLNPTCIRTQITSRLVGI